MGLLSVLHRLHEANLVLVAIRWDVTVIHSAHILDRDMGGWVYRAPFLHRAHPIRVCLIIRILGRKRVDLHSFWKHYWSVW